MATQRRCGGRGVTDHELCLGDVNPGWSAKDWVIELRRMANCCETNHPEKAAWYRVWATEIEIKNKEPAGGGKI